MSAIALPLHLDLNDDRLHVGFVAILPRIERHARISFRDIRCPGKKEDLVAETIALSWAWYLGHMAALAPTFPEARGNDELMKAWDRLAEWLVLAREEPEPELCASQMIQ
jgi:hypothetical protein